MTSQNIKGILIVDDNEESLEDYQKLLKVKFRASVVTTKFPTKAIQMAS